MRIVFDVDGTTSNGQFPGSPHIAPRPGIELVFEVLKAAGVEIYLWSTCGADYCANVATTLGFAHFFSGYFEKAEYLMTYDAAVKKLGFVPDLTVDDDATEQIPGIPFLQVEGFFFMNRVFSRGTGT